MKAGTYLQTDCLQLRSNGWLPPVLPEDLETLQTKLQVLHHHSLGEQEGSPANTSLI